MAYLITGIFAVLGVAVILGGILHNHRPNLRSEDNDNDTRND